VARAAQTSTTYTLVNLDDYFNNDGISWDHDPIDGDLDFGWMSLPAEQLARAGQAARLRGVYFVFPPTEDGRDNNIVCYNQVVKVPATRCVALHMLVTSISGTRRAAFNITYVDGSSSTVSQRIPDMKGAPGFGGYVGVETDHKHSSEGDVTPGGRLYVFSFKTDPAREVVSVTLPEEPAIRVFAITLQSAEE
jgi:hypothetical protein